MNLNTIHYHSFLTSECINHDQKLCSTANYVPVFNFEALKITSMHHWSFMSKTFLSILEPRGMLLNKLLYCGFSLKRALVAIYH
jgi:hypothetical protein